MYIKNQGFANLHEYEYWYISCVKLTNGLTVTTFVSYCDIINFLLMLVKEHYNLLNLIALAHSMTDI